MGVRFVVLLKAAANPQPITLGLCGLVIVPRPTQGVAKLADCFNEGVFRFGEKTSFSFPGVVLDSTMDCNAMVMDESESALDDINETATAVSSLTN